MTRLNKFKEARYEAGCGQFAINAGLRIAQSLEKKAGHKYEYDVDPEPRPRSLSLKPLQILNWIALFFAQSNNDSAAVAISKDSKSNSLYVHVSINKDVLDDAYRKRANVFLKCIFQEMTRQAHPTTSNANSIKELYHGLIRILVNNCWPMIQHRLHCLKTAIEKAGIESITGHFNKLGKNTNSNGTADGKLRESLMILSIDASKINPQEERVKHLGTALVACHGLIMCGFIPKSEDTKWHSGMAYSTYRTLDVIYRHFNSVHSYHSETYAFAEGGIGYLRQYIPAGALATEKAFQDHVKVVWAHDSIRTSLYSQCSWELSPAEWISRLLDDYKVGSSLCQTESAEHQSKLLAECDGLWTKGTKIVARVHPEVELIYYLEEKQIHTLCDVIGTDSDLCFMCGHYINCVNKRRGRYWLANPGSPNKIEEDWLLPPISEPHPVGRQEWALLAAVETGGDVRWRAAPAIDAFLEKHRTKPRAKVDEADVEAINNGPPLEVDYNIMDAIRSSSGMNYEDRFYSVNYL